MEKLRRENGMITVIVKASLVSGSLLLAFMALKLVDSLWLTELSSQLWKAVNFSIYPVLHSIKCFFVCVWKKAGIPAPSFLLLQLSTILIQRKKATWSCLGDQGEKSRNSLMTRERSIENLMTKEGSIETDFFPHNLSDGMNLCFLKKQQQKKPETEAP